MTLSVPAGESLTSALYIYIYIYIYICGHHIAIYYYIYIYIYIIYTTTTIHLFVYHIVAARTRRPWPSRTSSRRTSLAWLINILTIYYTQWSIDYSKRKFKVHGDFILCPSALFGSRFSCSISWQNSG